MVAEAGQGDITYALALRPGEGSPSLGSSLELAIAVVSNGDTAQVGFSDYLVVGTRLLSRAGEVWRPR